MKNIAIITGASRGIGREFVKAYDGKFDEIWGIGLEQELLEKVKNETKQIFRALSLDLTQNESFDKLIQLLKTEKPNVSLLINASGFGKFGRYDEINLNSSLNMIDLNCRALVSMTETVLPYMSKGSHIVEIGSVAGFQPIPYMAVYGASKAFVISYSRALNQELKQSGIKVTCVCPFWTKTKFFDRALKTKAENVVSKYIVMYNPQQIVKKAIKDMNKGKELSICGFVARSQVRLVNIMPKKFVMKTWIKQQKLDKKYKNKSYQINY